MRKSSIMTKVVALNIIETVEVNMDLNDEDEKAFATNPEEMIERLLKESGHVVNRITLMKRETLAKNARPRDHWYHMQVPESERSGWFCCCA